MPRLVRLVILCARNLFIFDTTLRDGEQVPGCQLNTTEKIEVAKLLESLGVDVIEAGFPISSPGDFNSVLEISKAVSAPTICALTRAVKKRHRRGRRCPATGQAQAHPHGYRRFAPAHLRQTALDARENPRTGRRGGEIRQTLCRGRGVLRRKTPGRADPQYLARVVEAAIAAGLRWSTLPDTTGYCLPHEYGAKHPNTWSTTYPTSTRRSISTHCHNDLGMATANTLSGILNGARQPR